MNFTLARPRLRQHGEATKDRLGGTTKRLFDLILGSLFLLCTLPVLVFAAAALKVAGATPVFTRAPRLGFKGRPFVIVEFRTKAQTCPLPGSTSRKPRRRTATIGLAEFLHDSGIDKLPQLVNVLRGEMSLVGPRALHPSEASGYGDWIAAYLATRPGLVQVPNTASLEDHPSMQLSVADLDYVRNWHLSTDVIALLRAIFTWKER